MKNFIEVTSSKGERLLINVAAISHVSLSPVSGLVIVLIAPDNDKSNFIRLSCSYEEIKSLIREALS